MFEKGGCPRLESQTFGDEVPLYFRSSGIQGDADGMPQFPFDSLFHHVAVCCQAARVSEPEPGAGSGGAASLLFPGIEADTHVVIMLLVDLRVVHFQGASLQFRLRPEPFISPDRPGDCPNPAALR